MRNFKLLKKIITKDSKPYIIAEMSANHNGSLRNAKKLVEAAKYAGADAIKIQTYTPDTMTINSKKNDFIIKSGIWKNKKLYSLYEKAHTPWEWHKTLFQFARKNNITIFGTPYDHSSVKFLKSIKNPIYKIASFEMNDHELISDVLKTGKPTIISTGMASIKEIKELAKFLKNFKNKNYAILYCVSSYPANVSKLNLASIKKMEKIFNVPIGFSDHTLNIDSSLYAVAMGAKIIERHITLSRSIKSEDAKFSLEPNEFKQMTDKINSFYLSKGKDTFLDRNSEKLMKNYRRSIYVVKNVKKGSHFNEENIKKIRPGLGIEPKNYKKILGKIANKKIQKGTALKWSHIKKK